MRPSRPDFQGNSSFETRILLGPAGSGKTHQCLAEIRSELRASSEGPQLILLAPKQATFQLERQLLADGSLPGYSRLQILSFERLADFILSSVPGRRREYLDEEGRVMVLRALLARRQDALMVFRATARLPGFARQLSQGLRELQRCRVGPGQMSELARQRDLPARLRDKLHDLALLLQAYYDWLREHQLEDADARLDMATAVLASLPTPAATDDAGRGIVIGRLWLDGFAEMTAQETELLVNLLPRCQGATVAFCLESEPREELPWLSTWSVMSRSFRALHARLSVMPGCRIRVEVLTRDSRHGRFGQSPDLARLERYWGAPPLSADVGVQSAECGVRNAGIRTQSAESRPRSVGAKASGAARPVDKDDKSELASAEKPTVRLICCVDPEVEAVFAAREVRRWVREQGARFRDVAVLLRSFEHYHIPLCRVFQRYEIPFFLDRRETVAHHPLAELTRFALRTVIFRWALEDWLGALRTGLAPASDEDIDELETAARAHGWAGEDWQCPLPLAESSARQAHVERIRQQVVPPFMRLARRLTSSEGGPVGAQLAEALRELWNELAVPRTLERWSRPAGASVHATMWEQMQAWLDNLDRGFHDVRLPLREWLAVIEAGLSGLTVGVVPPALDQVLIGTIDRSRNPDLRMVFVLGLNESVFPASPPTPVLLTEADRTDLERVEVNLGLSGRWQLGQEQYYGYIASTRASERLILTYAEQDQGGQPLKPSPFLERVRRCLPGLTPESFSGPAGLAESEHVSEVVPRLVQAQSLGPLHETLTPLASLPAVAPALARAAQLTSVRSLTALSSAVVAGLYGSELRASVTALEEFAACPFKFFVARGLRAAEREEFIADPRQRGSFEHEILKAFHLGLEEERLRWRDLSPREAGDRVARLGAELLPAFRDGLLNREPTERLAARLTIEDLRHLVETLVGWMPQYAFDPSAVELGFGLEGDSWPGWQLDVPPDRRLVLRGRIDRVDLCASPAAEETLAVVLDYKSRGQKLDVTKLHHGLELQLLAYLNALVHIAGERPGLARAPLRPAGAFYVGLRAHSPGARSRTEAHEAEAGHRAASHQHSGRFLADALEQFDNRHAPVGDQFKYRKNQDGEFSERGTEALPRSEFNALLAQNEAFLRRHAKAIFRGDVSVAPFRTSRETACERCDYRAICRFDPWLQPYRFLAPPPKAPVAQGASSSGKGRKS